MKLDKRKNWGTIYFQHFLQKILLLPITLEITCIFYVIRKIWSVHCNHKAFSAEPQSYLMRLVVDPRKVEKTFSRPSLNVLDFQNLGECKKVLS